VLRRSPLILVLAAALASSAVGAASGAAARRAPAGKDPGQTRIVDAGFEQTLKGWTGWNSKLSLVRGGSSGRRAAHVAVVGGAGDFSIVSAPPPVSSTHLGAVYRAGASVRSAIPGRTLCLRMREWAGSTVAGSAQSCLTATRSWQRFQDVTYKAQADGRRLDVYVYELPAQRGDSFDVDDVSLAVNAADEDLPITGRSDFVAPGVTVGPPPLYGESSPLNQPIPDNPMLDPDSPAMVQQLVVEAQNKGWPVSSNAWTPAVFFADASTPRHDVRDIDGAVFENVPIPSNMFVPTDGDSEIAVIDRSTGCEYDLARRARAANASWAHANPDGSWSSDYVNAIPFSWGGIYSNGTSVTASGFANAAGVILASELESGRINHALAFTMYATKAGGPVWPATVSDGWSTAPGAIPEGARVQLDPALDLDSLGLTQWQKAIAQALQRYGMFLMDTGGAFALRVQHAGSVDFSYPWGLADAAYMPTSLASHLRVLKLPPQTSGTWSDTPTPCSAWR
jgi:hypothetical protein